MDARKSFIASVVRQIHKRFIWLLIGSYALAAFFPAFGLWMRDIALGEITLFQEKTRFSLPMLMLAFLLVNAGLGVQTSQLRNLLRHPLPLIAGLSANLVIPIAFIWGVMQGMRLWHNPDEVQNILVGLALVASMPIAGSSTAWSQNANGNLALSLGLVLFSTLLSPLTTPIALHSVGWMAAGDYAEDLHELAMYGTAVFLAIGVILPSLLGALVQAAVGQTRLAPATPFLKLINFIDLLLLNYSNASVSLPQAVAQPDPDFLAVTLAIVLGLCVLAFASGWLIARLLKADPARQISLMFGLGLNNNGTGLVLASMALADHPRVMLPIIFYNLVQHLVAGSVDFVMWRKLAMPQSQETPPSSAPPPETVPGRRRLLKWLSLALGGLATAAVGIPIIGYFLGPLWQDEADEWVDLGPVEGFPTDQTRLVDFRHPHRQPWDGVTAQVAAYVRREKGDVKVFSVHCTHLGCPVSWFPESGLFMCPCHGGVYYKDGQHAAGPPPRGLFRYRHKVENGRLYILAGHLPTLHEPLS